MMQGTMELLGKIITNILTALYEPFGFSLLSFHFGHGFFTCMRMNRAKRAKAGSALW